MKMSAPANSFRWNFLWKECTRAGRFTVWAITSWAQYGNGYSTLRRNVQNHGSCSGQKVVVEPCFHRRSGATIVELLITTLIVALVAVALGAGMGAVLAFEQNVIAETGVRTAMVLQMVYSEQYFSLANSVVTSNTAHYRRETGGVSFETNRWISVTSVRMDIDQGADSQHELMFEVESADPRNDSTVFYSPFGLLYDSQASNTMATLAGTGALRRLTLTATYPVRTRHGTVIRTNVVHRPVRLWNYNP